MPLPTATKYVVRDRTTTFRLDKNYDTIEAAQAAIDATDNPGNFYIGADIVYVTS